MSGTSVEQSPVKSALAGRMLLFSTVLALAGSAYLILTRFGGFAGIAARMGSPHAPDLSVFSRLSPLIRFHLLVALGAIGLGVFMMMSRKGQRFHRIAGWIWSVLVMAIAVSSLFMSSAITGGRWGPLHLGSAWVIVFLPLAVYFARRHRVAGHRALMRLMFFGTLLISGALTFLPGRIMWQVFFD